MGEMSQRVERHVLRALEQAGDGGARVGPWGGRLALSSLVLRSLRQAYYSPKNIGHAGLRARRTTATSPRRSGAIRTWCATARWCQRSAGGSTAPRAGELGELGEWTSERERAAMKIERGGDDLARCFALEQALYEEGWERVYRVRSRG